MSTMKFAVTDPHDRVYAIRALAKVGVDELVPDYALPLPDFWRGAVELLFTAPSRYYESGSLEASPFLMLSLAGTQSTAGSIATSSWFPQLVNATAEYRRKHSFHDKESRDNFAGSRSHFEAVIITEEHVLSLRSKLVCRISKICDKSRQPAGTLEGLPRHISGERLLEAWNNQWQIVKSKLIPWYLECYGFAIAMGKDPAIDSKWFAALLMHGKVLSHKAGRRLLDDHHTELMQLPCCAQAIERYGLDISRMEADLNPFLTFYIRDGWHIDQTRLLAYTVDGHIGWTPQTSQPGDFVCLFQGSPFPFIVRERGDGYYTLIGDAYIHGIMQGEAWPENEEDREWIGLK